MFLWNRVRGAVLPVWDEITSTPNERTKFGTYYRDSFTGVDYADQRWYASAYGRFLTPDPYGGSAHSGSPSSWNRYSYTTGDPVNGTDPSGLDETTEGTYCPSGDLQSIDWDVSTVCVIDTDPADNPALNPAATVIDYGSVGDDGVVTFMAVGTTGAGSGSDSDQGDTSDPSDLNDPLPDPEPLPPSCVSGSVALGVAVGSGILGPVLGGVGGLAGGIGGTFAAPGVGTVGGVLGGIEIGADGGALLGGLLGGAVGGLLGNVFCNSNSGQGKGERNAAANPRGTNNPGKHAKPDPQNPGRWLVKDPHTGKWTLKPRGWKPE